MAKSDSTNFCHQLIPLSTNPIKLFTHLRAKLERFTQSKFLPGADLSGALISDLED
jgi:hypothetical protein